MLTGKTQKHQILIYNTFSSDIQASILYKSIAGRYRHVSYYADGPIAARYRFIKNTSWDISNIGTIASGLRSALKRKTKCFLC